MISGDDEDEKSIEFMTAIHDLYAANKRVLSRAYRQRERAKKKREEYLRLNPPQPEDIEISFWNNDENIAK